MTSDPIATATDTVAIIVARMSRSYCSQRPARIASRGGKFTQFASSPSLIAKNDFFGWPSTSSRRTLARDGVEPAEDRIGLRVELRRDGGKINRHEDSCR